MDTRFSYEGGYVAAKTFFSTHPEATAAFCMSDIVAAGAMRALADLGKRIPEDVSVFGFDGIDLSNYMIPRLSTVIQPAQLLAEETVNAMEALLDGRNDVGHTLVDAELVIRESISELKEDK